MNKQPILIGSPKVKPELLIERLIKFFTNVSSVKVAYMAQIFNPATKEPPHLSIGLIIDEDLMNIAHDIDNIVKKTVERNEFIEVIDIGKNNMESAYSKLKPFYVAEKETH